MYICIANHDTEEIAFSEEYTDPADIGRHSARLAAEAEQRTAQGLGDWRFYRTDSVFAFPTAAEIAAAKTAAKKSDIVVQLSALDAKSARSLRAIAAGTSTDDDKSTLADLEAQAVTLRAELAAL
jgi:hypothetical protein